MSPLLFVVLLGLLAGLLLFVVVIGLGALVNLVLDRTKGARSERKVKRAYAANDEVREKVAVSKSQPEKSLPRPKREKVATAPEPVLAEAPSVEMAMATGTPVVGPNTDSTPIVAAEPERAQKPARRVFPKREEPQVAPVADAAPEPATAKPEAATEPERPVLVAAQPVEAHREQPAEEHRVRRHLPKPNFPSRAKEEPSALPEPQAEPEAIIEPAAAPEPKPEPVDPFAGVLAALNKR